MDEIQQTERQITELIGKLNALRKKHCGKAVHNYLFSTLDGEVPMLDLFADHKRLLLIHNMGRGCRYCTLWADGFNGLLPHLESAMSVVLVSKDAPDVQRQFANSRGWRFRLASHGGGDYIREQSVVPGEGNTPGAVVYEREGDTIFRKNGCVFGPGDIYCAMWSLLGLAGLGEEDWTPQFSYGQSPQKLGDGDAGPAD
ncbi:DUF899 family protein [Microbulbifer halophilus]|uniref:DUF899 family protein n=1 Tax=Microbulbifer halophilus TaxID=453963 RepID=A0ABW5E5F0_9GAMM|nr:DUF899 family protein [Microbulbifer halophilus]MCW8127479.1 DUF899 family protein [Microbulbifer halophilus]